MEIDNITFYIFTNSILYYIEFSVMEDLIDTFKIDDKDKNKLKFFVKVIQKYELKDMIKRKIPKFTHIAVQLIYLISKFYINNYRDMNEIDIKKIEYIEEFVKVNKIKESDYLDFCNNFKAQHRIIDFFRDKCYCCLDFKRNDKDNLVIFPRLNV